MNRKFWLIFVFSANLVLSNAQGYRTIKDLSQSDWKLWLDKDATWITDKLYTGVVDVTALPENIPTGGWDVLNNPMAITVHLPATVEQYYWGNNGNPFGVSGNYLGVSWFYTKITIPESIKGKRLVLQFESVRFRAEVFVNRRLTGYDLVNSTPFEVDITNAVKYGSENELAVRITDPNGNFDWRDSQNFMWGNYRTIPTHGFGGITGKVKLVATDNVYIGDVFVRNKPKVKDIDVQVTINNLSGKAVDGTIVLHVNEAKGEQKVYERTIPVTQLRRGISENTYSITLNDAKLWSVDQPNLYFIKVSWKGEDNTADEYNKRFGFRWFEVRDVNGDKQFYLNGKRIVLRTSISWGFWPVNGITPSDELARKQVETAKKLGLNMLNFHRTIGQQIILDYADELGLLYFEEPGGNQYPADLFNAADSIGKIRASFYFFVRNEKLFRMIKRDRSHPSLVIYNMHNERGAPPKMQDSIQMHAGHKLDPSRIMTYNSSNGDIKMGPDPRFKLHLLPYDTTFYGYGWFDQHHAGGPGVYHDNLYKNPKEYLRYTDHKDEIIYWGEEGAIGTPPRLQLIREEILKSGKEFGWETETYLKWYDVYDLFIKNHGFSKAFPNVDSLTRKMGNVAYYYQGRVIENIRINNIADGYAVNGWESMKLENHSGIVDNYRNPKGDINLIARYNRPLFVAVKLNHKVLAVGDTTIADFFVVNELNLKGKYNLKMEALNEQGEKFFSRTIPVKLSGGNVYGELLVSGIPICLKTSGYSLIKAELQAQGKTVASGDDQVFAVKMDISGIPANGMVADTGGIVQSFLQSLGIKSFQQYRSGRPKGKYLLVGDFNPPANEKPLVTDILEWVNVGNTLIVIYNTDTWASYLSKKEVMDYRGFYELGKVWYGGNYFVKDHRLFDGLPQSCVFNWEYQCFAAYNKNRIGLRMFNGETIVGCVSDHKQEVYSALSVVPHGRGKIILCALDIFSCIKDIKLGEKPEGEGENAAMASFNASQKNKANIVGQQLLLNMLKQADRN
jgi:hypothetical protein